MKKHWRLAMSLGLWLALSGCAALGFGAKDFTANTTANANKDGFTYSSNKNQESLAAEGEFDPATGKMTFKVKTSSTTPESSIAAALQANAQAMTAFSEIMKEIIPLAKAAATKGAVQ